MRLFLDANILFSAAYKDAAPAALLIDLALATGIAVMTSRFAADEARRNVEAKAPACLPALDRYLAQIPLLAEAPARLVELAANIGLPSKDAPILAAAWAARATHLVTGDRRHFGSLYDTAQQGTRIVLLRTALELVVDQSGR